MSRTVKSGGDEAPAAKTFMPRLDRHRGRLEALRALGLITVDNTAAVRNALDDYIERLLSKVGMNILDLDQLVQRLEAGDTPSEALKRVARPGEAIAARRRNRPDE